MNGAPVISRSLASLALIMVVVSRAPLSLSTNNLTPMGLTEYTAIESMGDLVIEGTQEYVIENKLFFTGEA
jgi:hypothetical protein